MPIEKLLKYPRHSLAAGLILLLVLAGVVWWSAVWQSPKRVFEDMLGNNLAASSVTKHAIAGTKAQGVDQYVRLEMGAMNAAQWLVTAKQSNSSVTTESIGTPTEGYVRYTKISSSQKDKKGHPYDFKSVRNVWGKADGKTDRSLSQLFSQSVLDVSSAPLPPIGNLPPAEQQTLLQYMRANQVFAPTYDKLKRETIDGRAVYTYPVAIKLSPYVRVMQMFSHDLGMTSLDTVNPDQYAKAPPLTIMLSVDRISHQLVKVNYEATGFSQTYSDWGLRTPITLPKTAVSTTELQKRLQQFQ